MSKFKLSVVTLNKPAIEQRIAPNWGDNAALTIVDGFPLEIAVHKDGHAQFSMRIMEDGQIILTDYEHMGFHTYVGQNFRLHPDRPWHKEPARAADKESKNKGKRERRRH